MMHTSIYKNRKWYQVFTLFCLDSVGGRQLHVKIQPIGKTLMIHVYWTVTCTFED